ncbi:hypothetical protein [Microvirga yunnanensis]|nr:MULTISPECIES: hypothetical protein [unclassified Microvirga]
MKQRPDMYAEAQAPDPFGLPFARSIEWAGLIGGLALFGWALMIATQ